MGKLVIIAGPTASGKSALALAVAREFGGVVVNADSMQVYRELRVLTARPSAADEALAPHRLYGVLPAAEPCSAGRWRALALAEIAQAEAAGRLPLVVGGTGLYLRALIHGLSPVPDVPAAVRAAARARRGQLGAAAFHAELAARDPESAARLRPADTQRVMRAWEVVEATGVPLAEWRRQPGADPLAQEAAVIRLDPPRQALYSAIDARFGAMLEAGALDEVQALLAQGLDPALPAMKATGVPELAAFLRGEVGLEQAAGAARQATRRYSKRQWTWLRHQLPSNFVIGDEIFTQQSAHRMAGIFAFIRDFLLTPDSGAARLQRIRDM